MGVKKGQAFSGPMWMPKGVKIICLGFCTKPEMLGSAGKMMGC